MRLFIIFTIFFTVTIYILDSYIFGEKINTDKNFKAHIEIEPDESLQKEIKEAEKKQETEEKNKLLESAKEQNIKEKIYEKLKKVKKASRIIFLYKPTEYQIDAEKIFKEPILSILNSKTFKSKIQEIVIILYKNPSYVRGNTKNKVIRLYNLVKLNNQEVISVFIHELSHYIDLYYFDNNGDYDVSHEFYSISWKTSKVQRAGMEATDFVSGYAATNSYEDFAESLTYYILHNNDFSIKANDSLILKMKYDFLSQNLFKNKEFKSTDFSDEKVKSYYRDITKIDFSLEKFLEYIKK